MERYELPEGWESRALGDPEVAEINPKKSVMAGAWKCSAMRLRPR